LTITIRFQGALRRSLCLFAQNVVNGKIIESVREVHNGGAPMTPRVARSVLDMFTRTARPHKDYGLPTREQKNPGADDPGPDQKEID